VIIGHSKKMIKQTLTMKEKHDEQEEAPECGYFLNQIRCGERATHTVKGLNNKYPFYCCADHAAYFKGLPQYKVSKLEKAE